MSKPSSFPVLARDERGQVLVVFALFLLVLTGFAALVVDVSSVYVLQRHERSVADAAALAGAQDLQVAGTRALDATSYTRARTDAWTNLVTGLNGDATPPACAVFSADIVGCAMPGTPYQVSIKTPSPSYAGLTNPTSEVDPQRTVQVTVDQPSFQLSFTRLFGQSGWNVGITSVAGIRYVPTYAIITLRPPNPLKSGTDQNLADLSVNGGTVVHVYHGDVGVNTDYVPSGTGSALKLDDGYLVYHYDPTQPWAAPPQGQVLAKVIPDPNYTIPVWEDAYKDLANKPPTFTTASDAVDTEGCAAQITIAQNNGYKYPAIPYNLTTANTTCYKPGIYNFDIAVTSQSQQPWTLLEPGIYYFDHGLTMYGGLIGGYEDGAPGVALVFTEGSQCKSGPPNACFFTGNSSPLIALNAGGCIQSSSSDCGIPDYKTDPPTPPTYHGAAPARDWNSTTGKWDSETQIKVDFTGPGTLLTPVPKTLIVSKDPNCIGSDGVVPTAEPANCADSKNTVINLPGGSSLYVAGAQYAPTDNVAISGGSGGTGRIGQIVAWSLFYTGGSQISEFYPAGAGNGVLRLNSACSGPGMPCIP